ncbi:MAG TPA: YceI family protein, partial [Bacteroidia bacterium]|nr:YceI family protein [Bacteroidia bacterium]
VNAQNKWNLDASHSNVNFTVSHLVVSEVDGNFKIFNGDIVAKDDSFEDATINFNVDVASINTENKDRDAHLKSDDFFNAEKFPKMSFKSSAFKKVNGNKYVLKGFLTIRDVTKPVSFDVTFGGVVKDPWGNTKAGFKATTTISRSAYKLLWNKTIETGGAVVGDEVTITVKTEFAKAK